MRLRIVYFWLEHEKWRQEVLALAGELEETGITCRWIALPGVQHLAGRNGEMSGTSGVILHADRLESWRNMEWESEAVLITDSKGAAREAARHGMVCIACADEKGFFDGAQLVVSNPAELEAEVLEEFFLRTQGLPVTIARTERLVIREIAEEDFARLREISMQEGMELALRGNRQADEGDTFGGCGERTDAWNTPPRMFSDEYLSMYIKYVYKFFGYGLWSVFLHDGTLIGCCGFCNLDMDVTEGEENTECGAGRHCQVTERESGSRKDMQAGAEPVADGCGKTAALNFHSGGSNQESASDDGVPAAVPRRLELQYMLAQEAQGQGYAQEMCRAALRFAFARTDADEVWVCVHRDNVPSVRLAERLGFTLVNGKDAGGLLYYRLSIAKKPAGGKEKSNCCRT